MNYVQDFVKYIYIVGVMASAAVLLGMFRKVDEELQEIADNKMWVKWFWWGLLISMVLAYKPEYWRIWEWSALVMLGVYLVVCTVTDLLLSQVYDMMQFVGILGGSIWVLTKDIYPDIGLSLIFFALIQYGILIRMYGKADGMGYGVCSLYLAGVGMDIEGFLYHMVISFSLLAVVQGMKGNISKKGNLKKAVALYPYISMGFLIMWIFLF